MSADRHTTEDCLVIKALLRTSILGAKRTVRKSTCAFNEGIETEEERKRTLSHGVVFVRSPGKDAFPYLPIRPCLPPFASRPSRLPLGEYWVAGNKN